MRTNTNFNYVLVASCISLFFGCQNNINKPIKTAIVTTISSAPKNNPDGMIWVQTKTFLQGAKEDDFYAMSREKPSHYVTVDGFFIDVTEVTNKQFKAFVDATNYITVAERKIDWST